jgi:hypothetical protein
MIPPSTMTILMVNPAVVAAVASSVAPATTITAVVV